MPKPTGIDDAIFSCFQQNRPKWQKGRRRDKTILRRVSAADMGYPIVYTPSDAPCTTYTNVRFKILCAVANECTLYGLRTQKLCFGRAHVYIYIRVPECGVYGPIATETCFSDVVTHFCFRINCSSFFFTAKNRLMSYDGMICRKNNKENDYLLQFKV